MKGGRALSSISISEKYEKGNIEKEKRGKRKKEKRKIKEKIKIKRVKYMNRGGWWQGGVQAKRVGEELVLTYFANGEHINFGEAGGDTVRE
jgi:hypothetical protein